MSKEGVGALSPLLRKARWKLSSSSHDLLPPPNVGSPLPATRGQSKGPGLGLRRSPACPSPPGPE